MNLDDRLLEVLADHDPTYWSGSAGCAVRCSCGWNGGGFSPTRGEARRLYVVHVREHLHLDELAAVR